MNLVGGKHTFCGGSRKIFYGMLNMVYTFATSKLFPHEKDCNEKFLSLLVLHPLTALLQLTAFFRMAITALSRAEFLFTIIMKTKY